MYCNNCKPTWPAKVQTVTASPASTTHRSTFALSLDTVPRQQSGRSSEHDVNWHIQDVCKCQTVSLRSYLCSVISFKLGGRKEGADRQHFNLNARTTSCLPSYLPLWPRNQRSASFVKRMLNLGKWYVGNRIFTLPPGMLIYPTLLIDPIDPTFYIDSGSAKKECI